MSRIYFLAVLLCIATQLFAQEHLELKQFGFAMDAPKGWFKIQEEGLEQNLNRFDLNDEQQAEMLKSLSAASKLVSYYKYDIKKTSGIIPTINIAVRATRVKSFDGFKQHVSRSSEKLKEFLQNFIVTEPQVIEINGAKIWFTSANYDFKNPAGTYVKLVSKILYIYRGSYYISVNFIEEVGKEDNAAIFDEVIKTIKVTDVSIRK